jgi:hypothetical protein
MGLQKITFDGANVTSKIDADLYHFIFSNQIGVLSGLKNSVSYTLANNTITFQDGYVVVYGRLIYVEGGTSLTVSPDSVKFGYVVLKVDTSTNALSIYIKEQAGTYPILTEDNLLLNNGIYELALCAYTKTTTSVTLNNSYKRKKVLFYKNEIDTVKVI